MATSDNVLYDRRVRLTIANPVSTPNDFTHTTTDIIEINGGNTDNSDEPGLRIKFSIKKSLAKEPNTSEVTVTNLSNDRRSSLQHKGVKLLLEAGYKQAGVTKLCSMDVRTVDHVREGADWNTVLKLGDGERAWRFARVNESFAAGTRAADVIKKIARATGLELGNIDSKARDIDILFDHGYAAAGNALAALNKLVHSIGKTLSVQDGALQLLDPYESVDLPVPEITPQTGLVGSPEMGTPATKGKPQLLKFKSLLVVTKPGARVRLKSSRYDCFIRVHKLTYDGDSASSNWYTEIEGTIVAT